MKTINITANNLINKKISLKDLINAKTIRTAPPRFKATAFAIAKDVDEESGEVCKVGYIVAEDQTVYSVSFSNVISIISDIIEGVEENTLDFPVEIGVSLCNSNGGHEFITFSGSTGSQSCFHAIAKI